MLRRYFEQLWFNLADVGCEEAMMGSTALRRLVDIDLGRECVPEGTTLLKFRRLLEKHKLSEALFAKVEEVIHARGFTLGTGAIVAPPSSVRPARPRTPTKNATRTCTRPARTSSCTSL